MKFTSIARASKIQIVESFIGVSKCEGSHNEDLPNQEEDLLPFFLSNPELVLYYNNLPTEGTRGIKVKECLESLQYVDKHGHYRNASDEKFCRDHNI